MTLITPIAAISVNTIILEDVYTDQSLSTCKLVNVNQKIHNGPNATLDWSSATDGTIDTDGDTYFDVYYVDLTLQIHNSGEFYLIAFINLTIPGSTMNPFPWVMGQDMNAYSSGELQYLGDVLNTDITVRIAFMGIQMNSTGFNGYLGIWNVTLFDFANYDPYNPPPTVVPPIAHTEGNSDMSEPHLFTSSRAYSAAEFEPNITITADSWTDNFVDIDDDGVYYEYLHLQAMINSSITEWIEAEISISGYYISNRTFVTKDVLTPLDFWIPAYQLPNDGPIVFNETIYLRYWDEINQYWTRPAMTPALPLDYTTSDPIPLLREINPPGFLINDDNSTWSITLTDINSNGKFDYAVFNFPVDFDAYGFYEFHGELMGRESIYAFNTSWFPKGTHTVDLWFDIRKLRTMGDVNDIDPPLGNVTYPMYNFTIWNYVYLNGRAIDGPEDWTEGYIDHNHDLLCEDIDPLPGLNLPYSATLSANKGEWISFWINNSADISMYNMLNISVVTDQDTKYPQDMYDFQGNLEIYFETFDFSGYDTLFHFNFNINGPTLNAYVPLTVFGPEFWSRIEVRYESWDGFRIPEDVTFDITITPLLDTNAPTVTVNNPQSGATLSDEFGFMFNVSVIDDVSGLMQFDIFNSKLSNDVPIASTNPSFYYSLPEWQDDPHNITALRPTIDDRIITMIYPDNNWIGSYDLVLIARDGALNEQTVNVPITVIDDVPATEEEFLNHGLQWLKEQQQPDGSYMWSREDWRGHDDPGTRSVAFTSWAMLAFLQNGSSYNDPYVDNCYEYIKSQLNGDGSICSNELMGNQNYETSVAIMGLIPLMISYRAWGVSNSELELMIEDAVQWLVDAQNVEPLGYYPSNPYYGGWNYNPYNITIDFEGNWSDLSNTQWSIIALAAAREYGLDIPQTTWDAAEMFVRNCYSTPDDIFYGFSYQPEIGYGYPSSRMTAAGVWCLGLMGYDDTDTMISEALKWMDDKWETDYIFDDFYGEGYQYYAIVSAAKALLITGQAVPGADYYHLYTSIYGFLRKHVIRDPANMDLWFWDNTPGSEDPVYATLLAVLSAQVGFGSLGEAKKISITVYGRVHLHFYDDEWAHTGYNYTNKVIDGTDLTTYNSGPAGFPQQIDVNEPYKGYYHIYIYLIDDGEFNITVSARTSTGVSIVAKSQVFSGSKGDTYYTSFSLTTIYGINIGDYTPLMPVVWNIVSDPTLVGPSDKMWNDMDTSTHTLSWTALEVLPPVDYNISVNGVVKDSQTDWDGKGTITFDVVASDLGVGTYSILCKIIDANGEEAIDDVTVTVTETVITYTIEFTDPTDGSTLAGTETLQWAASSTPAEIMTYKLEYSADDGTTWSSLATGLTSTQFTWTTSDVSDGDYQLKVSIEGASISDVIDITISNEDAPVITPGFELFTLVLCLLMLVPITRRKRT